MFVRVRKPSLVNEFDFPQACAQRGTMSLHTVCPGNNGFFWEMTSGNVREVDSQTPRAEARVFVPFSNHKESILSHTGLVNETRRVIEVGRTPPSSPVQRHCL